MSIRNKVFLFAVFAVLSCATCIAACGGGGGGDTPGDTLTAPTGVSATAGDGEAVINWTTVTGADSYVVYSWDAAGISTALSKATAAPTKAEGAAAPYSSTGLANGTPYYFAVAAVNASGEGPLSDEVTATPQLGLPAAPANLAVTAGNKSLALAWDAVGSASSYKIYWNTTAGIDTTTPNAQTSATNSLTHSNLSNLSTYYYRVAAVNSTGEGPLSAEKSAKPAFGGDELQSVKGAGADEEYGYAVAIDGDTAVVGDPHYNGAGYIGSAFVYRYANGAWSLEDELPPPGGLTTNLSYGNSVAVSGDRAVVGCPVGNGVVNNSGVAIVFKRTGTTWAFEKLLGALAGDAASGDQFGTAVAVSSSYVAIGAPTDDNNGKTNNGAVYYWTTSDLNTQHKDLTGTAASDQYGRSVALSDSTLLIGAPNSSGNQGSAHLVSLNPLQSIVWLTATGGVADERYGTSVAIDGDEAIVGMQGNPTTKAGAAAVLHGTGGVWTEVQRLTPSATTVGDQFGTSVAISGNYAIVGAPLDDKVDLPGSVYIFWYDGTQWSEEGVLQASDSTTGDQFGHSVAIDGELMAMGAYLWDASGAADAGGAYFY